MGSTEQSQTSKARCATIRGLTNDTVIVIHRTRVRLALMRLRIETAAIQINRSEDAISESQDLVARLHAQGF